MKSILIIEDEPNIRELLTDMLTDAGYQILLAADGPSGLREAILGNPDVIVLDLGLPLMDGFEVLERLKSQSVTRDIPVLVVSAHAQRHHKQRALASGASDFITKPWNHGEVAAKVKSVQKADP